MLLKSELDIHSVVYSHTYTPSLQAKKLPFFLECTGRYVYGKEYYTEREGVNTYLLLFTIRGQGEIATPTQRFSVPAGCAALMDGNTWHRYACQGELWEMAWIHFCGGGVPAYLSYLFDAGERAVHIADPGEWMGHLETINTLAESREDIRDIHLCQTIGRLLDILVTDSRREVHTSCSPTIDRALELMRREYGEALTVAGLANRVHLSRFYFIRKFREQTGQSPYQYLTNLRINQSKKLLCCTEDTVESIARQVGFSDGAGFIHSFKQLVGMTPFQYRKIYVTWLRGNQQG